MGRRYVRGFNAVAKEELWNRWRCALHSQFNRVARQLNERSRETLGFETQAERDLMLVLHRLIEPTAQSRHPDRVGEVRFRGAGSTGHCNTARSLSAGVSKPKVFRGR